MTAATAAPAAPSKYLRPIRKGEYDMINISNLGYDPTDGRSFEECHAEWKAAFAGVLAEDKEIRWWQLRRRIRSRLRAFALASHYGRM